MSRSPLSQETRRRRAAWLLAVFLPLVGAGPDRAEDNSGPAREPSGAPYCTGDGSGEIPPDPSNPLSIFAGFPPAESSPHIQSPPLQTEPAPASPDSPPDGDSLSGEDTQDALPPEDAAASDRPYWRTNLFGRFFRDQKYLFTTWWPSELRREGFSIPLVAGIALASTSNSRGGEGADLEMQSYVQNETRGSGEGISRGFSRLGDAATGAVLIGTGYLIGRWSHHDQLAEASSLSAEALISAGLWSSVLKGLTARARPAGGTRGKFFDYNPQSGETIGSFPSGHATGAFTVATVFAHVYSDHKWVSWVAYGTAGLIGASRVALGRHFPSDVIVGALLGNSFGRMAVARNEDWKSSAFTFQPYVDPAKRQAGLVWTRTW
jgi:membrane-associated phospholipid phosphatase